MPNLSTITPETRKEEFLDRIARAAAEPNLPEVDTSDNGDVLTVVSGEWAAAAPPSELPEVTSSNNGQVLTVVSGEWATAAPQGGSIPSTREDIGKYLGVKESETETEVASVIPLQTSTIGQGGFATLNNCDLRFFKNASVGDTIDAVIDNVEMTLTATSMYNQLLFVNGNHAVGTGNDTVRYAYIGEPQPASVTISSTAEVPATEADWLAVPGPLVVTVTSNVSNATYNQVKAAIDRGESVRFIYNSAETGYLYCGFAISYEYDSEDATRPYKVDVIRTNSVDTFGSVDADTNTLSLR